MKIFHLYSWCLLNARGTNIADTRMEEASGRLDYFFFKVGGMHTVKAEKEDTDLRS